MHTNPPKHTTFSTFAHKTTKAVGSYSAFFCAAMFIAAWLAIGPFMHFSSEWEIVFVFTTGTVTLLTLFLLQHSHNHGNKALHLKLDELIRATKKARNSLMELEQLPEKQLDELKDELHVIHNDAVRQEEIRAEEAAPSVDVEVEKEKQAA